MQPPSTVTIEPVMKEAASEQRNRATLATSSGRPCRASGCILAAFSRRARAAVNSASSKSARRRPKAGIDITRADGVDANVTVVDGELAGEINDCGLGRAVSRNFWSADEPIGRRDVDNGPCVLRQKMRDDEFRLVEGAAEVSVDSPIELARFYLM